MKLFLLTLLGFTLGFFTVILLPVVFVAWLQSWIVETREPTDAPYRCDGGEEQPEEHPFFLEWHRLEAQRRMEVDGTPFADMAAEAARQSWVNKVEQMLQKWTGKE
jgi:hypothetical protein